MSDDATDPRIQPLLDQGLEAYGRGDETGAIAAWRNVLALDPANQQALDFLETAGAEERPAEKLLALEYSQASELAHAISEHVLDNDVLLEHVRKQRYEAALRLLYEARAKNPADRAISKSIQHLKRRLQSRFVEELGGLDGVPRLTGDGDDVSLGGDELATLELVDEISTVEDLVESSLLGRTRTLQALIFLTRQNLVRVRLGASAAHAPRSASPSGPPQQNSKPSTTSDAVSSPGLVSSPGSLAAPLGPPTIATHPTPAPTKTDFDREFQLGMRAYVRREFEEARHHFRRCLELRPGDVRAKINLERLVGR